MGPVLLGGSRERRVHSVSKKFPCWQEDQLGQRGPFRALEESRAARYGGQHGVRPAQEAEPRPGATRPEILLLRGGRGLGAEA